MYINNVKTILAGNANAFLKNQINNMERKIHSTVNILYPCNPAYSNWQVSGYLKQFQTKHMRKIRKTNMHELEGKVISRLPVYEL